MFVTEFPKWRLFVIATGGISLILGSIFWMKKKYQYSGKSTCERCECGKTVTEKSSTQATTVNAKNDIAELPDPKWVKVGTVKELYIYPLKSGRAMKLEHCDFTMFGVCVTSKGFILRDRMFLIYNEENYKYQTCRQFPTLVLVTLSAVNKTSVKLEGVGLSPLVFEVPVNCKNSTVVTCKLWRNEEIPCMDCGSEAAKWISRFLTGTDSGLRIACTFTDKFRDLKQTHWKQFMEVYQTMRNEDRGLFTDLASYLLMTESSLEDLNTRLEKPITMLQFRPNICVSGSEAFAEDTWEWIKIGESAVIRNFKSCTRCKMTCVDPQTGDVDQHEPLKSLRTYRQLTDKSQRALEGTAPMFGIYCGLYNTGIVKVGDDVFVHKSDQSPVK